MISTGTCLHGCDLLLINIGDIYELSRYIVRELSLMRLESEDLHLLYELHLYYEICIN